MPTTSHCFSYPADPRRLGLLNCFSYPADVPHSMPFSCFSYAADVPRRMPISSCFSYSAGAPLGVGNCDAAPSVLPGLRSMPSTPASGTDIREA
jgi:hypothetical protein